MKTENYAVQGYLFDDTVPRLEVVTVKKPNNTITFPVSEFPKEKQARERIRKRRESNTINPLQQELVEQYTTADIPTKKPTAIPATAQQRTVYPQPKPEKINRLPIGIIGASGLAAAGMSIYHGYHYLLIAGKPSWVSLITAVVMVVFSATIFSFPVKGSRFFSYALRILGFATVFFSIFCTIAVNYDQFSVREATESQAKQLSESKQAEIEILHLQIAGIEAQIDTLQQEMEYWKTISWARRDTAHNALQEAYAERSALWQQLNSVTDDAYQVTETKTIFSYLAGVFSISKNVLEFILFCIPAVFYDLLSALAVNAILRRSNYGK
jgi:hypothetical protein